MPMQLNRPGEAEAERTQLYCQNFTLATRRDERVDLQGEWLSLWRLLPVIAATDTYEYSYRYRANYTIYVRFDQPDNPLIPLEVGDVIRLPYSRIYLSTVIAGGAVPDGTFDLLYGSGPIEIDKNLGPQRFLLDDLLHYYEQSYFRTSAGGGDEVLSIAAATADAGANQACVEAIVWTPDADIHFTLGAGPAAVGDPLLPANACLTIPVNNTNLLQFYNAGAGAETVNIIYRS